MGAVAVLALVVISLEDLTSIHSRNPPDAFGPLDGKADLPRYLQHQTGGSHLPTGAAKQIERFSFSGEEKHNSSLQVDTADGQVIAGEHHDRLLQQMDCTGHVKRLLM
jgi:hypothetical protein